MEVGSTSTAEGGGGADVCVLDVSGMDCASCVGHVTRAAQAVEGVRKADVHLARGRAVVEFDAGKVRPEVIASAITDAGYPATPQVAEGDPAEAERLRVDRQRAHAREWFGRAVAGVALWLPVEVMHWTMPWWGGHRHGGDVHWMDWLALTTSTVAMVFIGGAFYRSAWQALRRGTTNMDTLIAMGTSVAYGYSLVALVGRLAGWWGVLPDLYFMEATGLLALISLGHWMEARARDQAGSAIRELLSLTPAVALRLKGRDEGVRGRGGEGRENGGASSHQPLISSSSDYEEVPVAQVAKGDRLLIRPGDRIPVDGVVVEGKSEVDESMITGEAMPVLRQRGDEVIAGTLNQTGRLTIRATKVGSETALAQIVRLVETAQNSKPPVQRLADRISAVFVLAVLGIAVVTGVGWWLYGTSSGLGAASTWGHVAKAVCSVLIIACPCALGLAVPAALMVGTGRGAQRGVLIRDIDALQHAEGITTVVLDKTGTITRGRPVVSEVVAVDGVGEAELIRLAATAEQFSEHPLAKSIMRLAGERGVRVGDPESFEYEPGLGVVAGVEGRTLLVGSEALLAKHGAAAPGEGVANGHRSVVHVARVEGDRVTRLGILLIEDEVKPDSKRAIAELHAMGLKTVLLTGDNPLAAEAIGREVGIDQVFAGVKPSEKAGVVRRLQAEGRGGVAMVGDGVNDAPALAAADLGIAIGSGSDIAKETGGVVLVSGSLHGIVTALRLSRATMTKIRQNLFFAFVYNVLAIPVAALGMLTPIIAAGAMALSDVTVIGNALLLRRKRID